MARSTERWRWTPTWCSAEFDVFVNNAGIVHAYGQPDTELDDCHTVYLTGIRVGMKTVLRGIQNARAS